ncbi:unnamed protein product [Eruca vesicaria subsp. sativa]|uniref:Uncharacterized protein n=1 Tax=Eruca vesicaria subsp. sativa TaxID=29727 RepID=A0ABC8KB77_ERUVS|nr:unnamed protein product [Eruca vesicaria subsp. sativa]
MYGKRDKTVYLLCGCVTIFFLDNDLFVNYGHESDDDGVFLLVYMYQGFEFLFII